MMNNESLQKFLTALKPSFKPRCNEPLSEHTTFRLGGPADIWLVATHLADLVELVLLARQHTIPIFIMGSGANLLISEAGIRGLVIENRCQQIKFPTLEDNYQPGEKHLVTVASGVILPTLARQCAKRGLTGLEWLIGIPGTVGGAVVNNAGAYDGDMAQAVNRVELLSPTGERVWKPEEWFQYVYRSSRLKQSEAQWIVLQAELNLTGASVDEVEAKMKSFNQRRKASQPPGATIGSMFKNPPHDYAGRLIEAAGLKGYRLGQAQISPLHANFFQNLGGATATELLNLIQTAQTAVKDKFDIELQLEIEVIGEFPSSTAA